MESVRNINNASITEINFGLIFWDSQNIERLKMGKRPLNLEGKVIMLIPNSCKGFEPKVISHKNQPEFTDEEYSEFVRMASAPCIWG